MKYQIPEAALSQHIAVLGKTGSGKTSTAKLAVEQVVGQGARVCVLGPIKSDWWGLISSADGKHAGLPFHILGGPRGHVPLHASAGKAIAEVVASGALPLSILDMADFEPGGHAQFFIHFIPTLLRRMRGVVYLVIEEAHLFAPKERSGIGAENMAIHWAKTLATAGRSKGIRLMVVTHRVQSLHNAVLGSCDTLIAHRLIAPADQDPVVKWLKANTAPDVRDQVAKSLSSLRTGTGWICSGEAKVFEQVEFPRIKTYDNTATPTGEGEDHAVKTAPVDTEKLRAIVGDAVREAEANDPKLLRAEIAKLKRELDKKPAEGPTPAWRAEYEEAHARETEAAYARGREEAFTKLAHELEPIRDHLDHAIADLHSINLVTLEAQLKAMPSKPTRPAPRPTIEPRPARAKPAITHSGSPDIHLPTGERAILTACAQYDDGCSREQLSVLTGYKRSSRDTYVQRLREKGYAAGTGHSVVATDAGIAALGPDFEPLPTGDALQQYWFFRLPDGERKILKEVVARHPNPVEREKLDELTGYRRSSRDTYIQRLRARQLVTAEGRGAVRASDDLFD